MHKKTCKTHEYVTAGAWSAQADSRQRKAGSRQQSRQQAAEIRQQVL
jgi:hypothetical protein